MAESEIIPFTCRDILGGGESIESRYAKIILLLRYYTLSLAIRAPLIFDVARRSVATDNFDAGTRGWLADWLTGWLAG